MYITEESQIQFYVHNFALREQSFRKHVKYSELLL